MAATLDDETFSLADHNRPIRRGKKKKNLGSENRMHDSNDPHLD
jgi:hypothetical protein